MTQPRLIAKFSVFHAYYKASTGKNWILEPGQETSGELERLGMRLVSRPDGSELYLVQPDAELTDLETSTLTFWLRTTEPMFYNFTKADDRLTPETVPTFILDGLRTNEDGTCTLYPPAHPEKMQVRPRAELPQEAQQANLGIQVSAAELLDSNWETIRYTLSFAARPVHWRYLFVPQNDDQLQDATIETGNSGLAFGPQEELTIIGQQAIGMMSLGPLPLSESYPFTLTLNAGALSLTLPAPNPATLNLGEDGQAVADIYVYL